MTSNGRYSRPEHVLMRVVGDEAIVLNTDNEKYFSLDQVGRVTYEAIVDGHPVTTVARQLCDSYDGVDLATAQADIEELVAELLAAGLLLALE